MTLLFGPARATAPEGRSRAASTNALISDLIRRRGISNDSGVTVDYDSASTHSAVYAACDLIARLVSTFPVHEFTRATPDAAPTMLATPALLDMPDRANDIPIETWLYAAVDSVKKTGNAFGVVTQQSRSGWPEQIRLVHPNQVTWGQNRSTGNVDWWLDGRPIVKWPAGDLWHLKGPAPAGSPVGFSAILYGALTIGVGLAAQRFGAQWFRDGAVPAGILTNDAEHNPAIAELVRTMWRQALAGNREPVVLGDGWNYQQISVNPEESQFLETIGANVADVARFFGVLPEDIGGTRSGGSTLTYANEEQSNLRLLIRSVQPEVVRFERALSRLRPRPRFVRFNVDSLLRPDATTRSKVYETMVRNGLMSPDEVRELEDRPAIPDGRGDRFLWPPMRQQLTNAELEEGSDSDAADGDGGGSDAGFEDRAVALDVATAATRWYQPFINGLVSRAEARAELNRAGANLSVDDDPGVFMAQFVDDEGEPTSNGAAASVAGDS